MLIYPCTYRPMYLCTYILMFIFMQELMSTISGRIPVSVESQISKCLSQYAKNITSFLAQFPSQQVQLLTVYNN